MSLNDLDFMFVVILIIKWMSIKYTCGVFLWQKYDACDLVKSYGGPPVEILIDQVDIQSFCYLAVLTFLS